MMSNVIKQFRWSSDHYWLINLYSLKGSSGPVYSNTGQYTATYTQEAPPPEEGDRKPTWSNQVEFLFTALAFVVGFGEVWRFPYMVYKNGGGIILNYYIID